MSCCNQKRVNDQQRPAMPAVSKENFAQVRFQYTGKTALSATGNISGRRYFFARTGDIQQVDYRDVAGLSTIAVLKRM